MRALALVVGIDAYPDPSWTLGGSSADALRFARWALESGGVAPADLRLLLSPAPPPAQGPVAAVLAAATRDWAPSSGEVSLRDLPPGVETPPATCQAIRDEIGRLAAGGGKGFDRLYFYFAGHGVSAPGIQQGGAEEPVLVPCDVESLTRHAHLLIGFSAVMPVLADVEPPVQFFFIDACRDFALGQHRPSFGVVGPWLPPKAAQGSAQFVLYATSPGQRAYEQKAEGRGVFGAALVEALEGRGFELPFSRRTRRYEVRFGAVAERVRSRVAAKVDRQAPGTVQLPQPLALRGVDVAVAEIEAGALPKVPLTVRIMPSAARSAARVSVMEFLPGAQRDAVVMESGPPVALPHVLELTPGDYAVRVAADRFAPEQRECSLWEPVDQSFELRAGAPPAPPPPPPPPAPAPPALESVGTAAAPAREAPAAAGPGSSTPPTGRLELRAMDRQALIVVRDAAGEVVAHGTGAVSAAVEPGIYRVRLVLPEGEVPERRVAVQAGRVGSADLQGPPLAPSDAAAAQAMGAQLAGGYAVISETLGGLAGLRLVSLLSHAAFAAAGGGRVPMQKLKRLGLLAAAPPAPSAVLIVVGTPDADRALPVGFAALDVEGRPVAEGALVPLAGPLPAAQARLEVAAGTLKVRLDIPGLPLACFAVNALPARLTALVVVANPDGTLDVEQHLLAPEGVPLGPLERVDPELHRAVESVSRIYARARGVYLAPPDVREAPGGSSGSDAAVERLLSGGWIDPMLAAMVGYAAQRDPALAARFAGADGAGRGAALEALQRDFAALPDAHVVAALHARVPADRDAAFARALRAGIPTFTEGTRAVVAWARAAGRPLPPGYAVPSRGLLPGPAFTAWSVHPPVLAVQARTFGSVPPGWEVIERKRKAVERAIGATGRIEPGSPGQPFCGTAFRVGERLALTFFHVVPAFGVQKGGRWRLQPGLQPKLDFGQGTGQSDEWTFPIEEIVAVWTSPPVALLRLGKGAARLPVLDIGDRRAVAEGRLAYLVSYPALDPRIDPAVLRRALQGESGAKRLHLGRILSPGGAGAGPGPVLLHDCMTSGGSAGAALVDAESGRVVGLHFAGEWGEVKTGRAVDLTHPGSKPVRDAIRRA